MLALDIVRRDETFRLLAELSGHHANAFLLDGDDHILTSLRPTTSRRRDLRAGRIYAPPLLPDGATTFCPDETLPEARGETLLRTIDARYGAHERHDAVSRRFHDLRRRVRRHTKRVQRRTARVEADQARAAEAEQWRQRGELLKTQLYAVRRGMERVELVDYASPDRATVVVPLAPELSPQENLERMFARYCKLQRAAALTAERCAAAQKEGAALDALAAELDGLALPPQPALEPAEAAQLSSALDQAERTAHTLGVPAARRHPPQRSGRPAPSRHLPYRAYCAGDGTPIYVGRGGRDNGELTFRVANDADPWLHVRDRGGAHVVVRRTKGRPVTRETLLDAALLAKHFSKARADTSAEVHVTPRRHVRPLKGAPAGTVRVERSETLLVHADEPRLERLLATREPVAPSPASA